MVRMRVIARKTERERDGSKARARARVSTGLYSLRYVRLDVLRPIVGRVNDLDVITGELVLVREGKADALKA